MTTNRRTLIHKARSLCGKFLAALWDGSVERMEWGEDVPPQQTVLPPEEIHIDHSSDMARAVEFARKATSWYWIKTIPPECEERLLELYADTIVNGPRCWEEEELFQIVFQPDVQDPDLHKTRDNFHNWLRNQNYIQIKSIHVLSPTTGQTLPGVYESEIELPWTTEDVDGKNFRILTTHLRMRYKMAEIGPQPLHENMPTPN